ncbi:hypothetical protein HAX54_039805 [Datura stramonium]|uniref:Uncharacterized protein n=1 Tax=Datura stramonium TaxID=4076 RepID=A0ABS8SKG4_DATST|nr:hypothetical protein [Datura stramonium]
MAGNGVVSSCSNNLASDDENGAGESAVSVAMQEILEEKYNELRDTYDFQKIYNHNLLYCKLYCKDVVFAGLEPAYDDHEEGRIIEDLWDFYQSNKAGKASEDWKTDSHTCNHFHHSGSRHGCSSTPKESRNFRDDGDSNAVNCSQCDSEETALSQLKADMQENRFVYIRPRKNVKKKSGYIRYSRKKDGAYIYAVHADYYILLRSCAKVAQVDVRTMHVGVLTFERRLEMLEKRIDFCLRKRLPDDFCEFCRDE